MLFPPRKRQGSSKPTTIIGEKNGGTNDEWVTIIIMEGAEGIKAEGR